jgi:hypothetical protein
VSSWGKPPRVPPGGEVENGAGWRRVGLQSYGGFVLAGKAQPENGRALVEVVGFTMLFLLLIVLVLVVLGGGYGYRYRSGFAVGGGNNLLWIVVVVLILLLVLGGGGYYRYGGI